MNGVDTRKSNLFAPVSRVSTPLRSSRPQRMAQAEQLGATTEPVLDRGNGTVIAFRDARPLNDRGVERARHPRGRFLIIVQNLPVPFDRRVWLECQTLRAAGHDVAVVCPKGPGDPAYAKVEGVELYKYRPYASKGSKASFVVEYLYSFLATLWLALKAARAGHFDAVQACNPPDIFWPIGILLRRLHGSRFVFDHHDLCPELFESRFPQGSKRAHRGLLWLERRTVASADQVIATNDSYRAVDIKRNGADPARATVVRTGPNPERLRPVAPDPWLRRGRPHLAAYIGVMGPQDGVDIVVRLADYVVNQLGRTDISFTLIGSGDCFVDLVQLRDDLGLGEYVEFTGRIADDAVAAILSTADVGISPDPKNPLNDLSTMNKTMEYMAFGLPVVAFDLRETRISAAEAGVYATPNEVDELANLLVELMDDPARRDAMGRAGRARIELELAWPHQAAHYAKVYEGLVARKPGLALVPAGEG
jgi:glycosyltransferase involved in cell wall biosynthesis